MASGDDVFIEEHRPLFPACDLRADQARHRPDQRRQPVAGAGLQRHPRRRRGRAGAAGTARPFVLPGPIAVRIQTQTPALADLFCQWPTLQRLDGDEVGFEAPTVEAAVRMVNCLSAMSTMLR